jgi:hypothetical protein
MMDQLEYTSNIPENTPVAVVQEGYLGDILLANDAHIPEEFIN